MTPARPFLAALALKVLAAPATAAMLSVSPEGGDRWRVETDAISFFTTATSQGEPDVIGVVFEDALAGPAPTTGTLVSGGGSVTIPASSVGGPLFAFTPSSTLNGTFAASVGEIDPNDLLVFGTFDGFAFARTTVIFDVDALVFEAAGFPGLVEGPVDARLITTAGTAISGPVEVSATSAVPVPAALPALGAALLLLGRLGVRRG